MKIEVWLYGELSQFAEEKRKKVSPALVLKCEKAPQLKVYCKHLKCRPRREVLLLSMAT